MLSALACSSRSIDCRNWKSPVFSSSDRLCVHTKKIVEPGRYSHRSTALPRSETKLKLGSLNVRESPALPVIGCTTLGDTYQFRSLSAWYVPDWTLITHAFRVSDCQPRSTW